jgi:transcriptional regulator with XRE-family HTH domain
MNIVKELRKKKGIQQKELAIELGVSNATVSDWERGKKDPSGDRLKKLAEYFAVDELVILGRMSPCAQDQRSIELRGDEYRLIQAYRKADSKICEAALTMLENSAREKDAAEIAG